MTDTTGFPAALLARIVESAPAGIALVDAGGIIRFANPAFLAIFGPGARAGSRFAALFDEADAGRAAALLAKVRSGAGGDEASAPISVRPREVPDGTVLLQATGSAGETLLFAIDVTTERRMARRLMITEKLETLTQLAAGIAHDFNNLLTALVGHADLLLARYPDDHPAHADVMEIKKSVERAAALVRDLFAFAGQSGAKAETIELDVFLAEVQPLLERVLGPDVAVTAAHGETLPAVHAGRAELEQALVAIARYSRSTMPAGGRFAIETGAVSQSITGRPVGPALAPGDYALIRVSDSGTPLGEGDIGRIFEPFFSPRGPIGGPGLGLAAAYGTVRQAGGQIFARRGEAAGSIFDIYLPALIPAAPRPKARPAASAPRALPPVERPATVPATVLIVEDEMPVRRFAVRALGLRGYGVIEAESGEAALMVLDSELIVDLMISDVMMPEMDGATLVREARLRRADLPILLISGYGPEVMRGVLDQHDRIDFLPKPFSLDELAAKVASVLG